MLLSRNPIIIAGKVTLVHHLDLSVHFASSTKTVAGQLQMIAMTKINNLKIRGKYYCTFIAQILSINFISKASLKITDKTE